MQIYKFCCLLYYGCVSSSSCPVPRTLVTSLYIPPRCACNDSLKGIWHLHFNASSERQGSEVLLGNNTIYLFAVPLWGRPTVYKMAESNLTRRRSHSTYQPIHHGRCKVVFRPRNLSCRMWYTNCCLLVSRSVHSMLSLTPIASS